MAQKIRLTRWHDTARSTSVRLGKKSKFPYLIVSLAEERLPSCGESARKKMSELFGFHTFDMRAEFTQFFVKMLVTAIYVIDAAHFGDSICFQPCQHQRG